MVDKLNDIFENILNIKYHTIFIDEGQFFSDSEFTLILEKLKINVVITGHGDFQRKPFGQILDLIPFSDNIIKQKLL